MQMQMEIVKVVVGLNAGGANRAAVGSNERQISMNLVGRGEGEEKTLM